MTAKTAASIESKARSFEASFRFARPASGMELLALLRDPAMPAAQLAGIIVRLLRVGLEPGDDETSAPGNPFLQRRNFWPRGGGGFRSQTEEMLHGGGAAPSKADASCSVTAESRGESGARSSDAENGSSPAAGVLRSGGARSVQTASLCSAETARSFPKTTRSFLAVARNIETAARSIPAGENNSVAKELTRPAAKSRSAGVAPLSTKPLVSFPAKLSSSEPQLNNTQQ